MSFSSEVVSIEIKDKVGTLWLDRPEKYNALSEQVWLDIPKALNELVKLDCRVIILRFNLFFGKLLAPGDCCDSRPLSWSWH